MNYDLAQHGRKAITSLRNHYDGPGARLERLAEDNQSEKKLHYSQDQTFLFERFITLLQEVFNILEDYEEARSEREKVRIMLQKITTNNVQIQLAISTTAMDDELSIDFTVACNKMSEGVSIIFPKIAKGRNSYRNISGYSRGGRGRIGRNYVGRGRGRGRGQYR